jgi:uncharacterized membrane protein (UPF0127 family)
MSKSYTVEVQIDDVGEYFIEIPDDILNALELDIGDTVEWTDIGGGCFALKKVL